jgi:hypothetical protein
VRKHEFVRRDDMLASTECAFDERLRLVAASDEFQNNIDLFVIEQCADIGCQQAVRRWRTSGVLTIAKSKTRYHDLDIEAAAKLLAFRFEYLPYAGTDNAKAEQGDA